MIRRFISQRTKSEWDLFFKEKVATLRIFVQENGEISALLGFLVGALMVLFYKPFALVFCLLMLAYLGIILYAPEDKQ